MAEETTKKIGQYELRSPLGRGGMATVWRAYQPSLDREVAIKVMSAQFTDDETFIKRFNQEARSIARLRHPYILSIYEYGQDENGQPYIVTELLDGGTLRDYMTKKPLDLRDASRIISQIGDALDYAHAQHMVHRDIKPSNILMGTQRTYGDRAVLSDFGIVKLLSSTNITQTGVGIGTPEYMSPEQASGEPLDGRSDEYSLGIVLYEMLTGVTPFKADTPLAVMMGHVNRPLSDPRTFNPNIPEEVVQVLTKALAKYPHERYPTVGEFADAFAQAVGVNSSAPLAQPKAPTPATGASSGAVRFNTGAITTAQAYDYALNQERQGNRQAAFETLSDIQKREPGYRDVPHRLEEYQAQHYQYSGQHTLFKPPVNAGLDGDSTLSLEVGPYKSPTIPGPYVASDATRTQAAISNSGNPNFTETVALPSSVVAGGTATAQIGPTVTATAPAKKGVPTNFLIIGGAVAGFLILAVIAIVIVAGGKKDATPTGIAANNTTSAATTSVATTNAATTAAATSAAVTTATADTPPPTALPTLVAEKADPARAQVEAITSQIYSPSGDLKQGVAKLKELAQNNKNSWLAQRELGRAYYWYVRDQGGKPFLTTATQLNSQDALSWAYLALADVETFDDVNAQAAIRKALDLNPNSAEVRAASALTLLRVSPQQSREEIDKALSDSTSKDNLLVNYAAWSVYSASGDKGALNFLNNLIDKYPNFPIMLYSKGYQFALQNNIPEATAAYNDALKIDPDFPTAHVGLGQIAFNNGDLQKAASEYQKAISVYDEDPFAFIGLGYTLAGMQKFEEAIAQFTKGIQLDRNNFDAYNGLASVYAELAARSTDPKIKGSNADLALNNANLALGINPKDADANYHKALALFQKENFIEAEKAALTATQLDANQSDYFTLLGAIYVKLNEIDQAKTNLKQAIQLNPNATQAKDLLKRIGG